MRLETRSLAVLAAVLMLAACDGEPMEMPMPPPAPELDEVAALTNLNPITITGTALADALVQVRGGAELAEATAGADGAFSVEVTLTADVENALVVSQTVDTLESQTVTVTVTHDGMPPGAPSVDPVTTPTRRMMQTVRGMTEAGATVTITGGAEEAVAQADESGHFEIPVTLNTVETGTEDNVLGVVARDAAGNESAPTEVTITFDPSITIEAPVLDDFPAFTNMSTVTLTGEAEAGAGIRAVGGATDGDATVAEDGTFSVDVGLRPNERNMILVFAVAGSETSIAAVAVITHDDVAPAAPNVDPEGSPTGADIVTLTGTAEPNVEIDVTGGAADAAGMVDDAGAFLLDVMLTVDADNALSVTARDAAGNTSEPVMLTITQDSTLEEPVQVNPVPSPTQNPTITLTGTATPDVELVITGGADAEVRTMTDPTGGSWSTMVELNLNSHNELHVKRDSSTVETILVVVHDDTPPEPPTVNDLASPTAASTVAVTGTSEPGANLSISGGVAAATGTAGADGRFSVDVMIAPDSTTTISVIATDRAGNSSPASTAMVTHSSTVPDAPVIDDNPGLPADDGLNPPPTNVAMHTVRGHLTVPAADVMVRITGGASTATGTTDIDGNFSLDVPLNANTVNTLTVVSIMGTIESAPAVVTITHDNIAPAAPDASLITVTRDSGALGCPDPLFGTTGNVRGSGTATMHPVEPLSVAQVENFSRDPGNFETATSTAMGTFTVTMSSCPGDIMKIRAIDAAGNVSDPAEINSP